MELYLGPGTTQGERYLPDEVAKQIIADMKLEKGQTLSKAGIVAYLNKHGISPLLATDVAMMLRNVYGVTPTFDEDKKMSANIIVEMNDILNNNYDEVQEQRFDAPVLTEKQLREFHQWAIQECFNESKDEVDELILARLAMMTPRQVENIALLDDVMDEEHYDEVEACLEHGGQTLAEAWFEVFVRPHKFRYLPEDVQEELKKLARSVREPAPEKPASDDPFSVDFKPKKKMDAAAKIKPKKVDPFAEALPAMALAGQAGRRTAAMARTAKPHPADTQMAQDKRAARERMRAGHQDPLAQRQRASEMDPMGGGHFARMAAGRQAMRNIDWTDKGQQIKRQQHQDVASQKQKIQSRMAKQGEAPLPGDVGPSFGSRVKQGAKTALGAVSDVGSMLGRGAAAAGRGVAAAGRGVGKAAGGVAAGLGHLAGRYQAAKAAAGGGATPSPAHSAAGGTPEPSGAEAGKEHPMLAMLRQHFGADHPVTQLAHQHLGGSSGEPEHEPQTAMAHRGGGEEQPTQKHGILRRMVGWAARGLGRVASRVGQSIKHGVRSRMPTMGHVLFGPESSGEADLANQKVRQAQRKLASQGRYVPRYGGEGGGIAGGGSGGPGRRPPFQRPGWRR